MRLATWNVNSVKQRVPRLLPWLDQRQPDVVCLQETKLADAAFTELLGEELAGRGYAVALHGEVQWNGVAILSRVGLDDVVPGLAGAPGFPRPEARALSATCGGIRVYSVYVPNGRVPDSDDYRYKLAWLAALRDEVAAGPDAAIVCGDMNIAPTDATSSTRRPTSARPTSPRRSGRPWPSWRRSACVTSCGTAGRPSGCSPIGTTGPACSTATSACGSTWSWPRLGAGRVVGMGRPARRKGSGPSDTPRDHRPGRGPRRRHRPGRAAAVRALGHAGLGQAAQSRSGP